MFFLRFISLNNTRPKRKTVKGVVCNNAKFLYFAWMDVFTFTSLKGKRSGKKFTKHNISAADCKNNCIIFHLVFQLKIIFFLMATLQPCWSTGFDFFFFLNCTKANNFLFSLWETLQCWIFYCRFGYRGLEHFSQKTTKTVGCLWSWSLKYLRAILSQLEWQQLEIFWIKKLFSIPDIKIVTKFRRTFESIFQIIFTLHYVTYAPIYLYKYTSLRVFVITEGPTFWFRVNEIQCHYIYILSKCFILMHVKTLEQN